MRNLYRFAAVAAMALMAGSFAAQAGDHHGRGEEHHDRHDKTRVLKVALWGDNFYADDANIKKFMIDQTIDSMNRHHLDFTLFAGDTKNGHTECTDQAIGQDVKDIFDSLNAPTLYTLGDNEWTDCHRTSNGSMDPLDRLAYLRGFFFDKSTTQGQHPIKVERQGALGDAYSENSRFVRSNVEFVALHIPGSNNNYVSTEKLCTNKSGRGAWDSSTLLPVPGTACADATAEYEARNAANLEWLHAAFDEARAKHYAGIVIVIQADVYTPIELADGGYHSDFLPSLDEQDGKGHYINGYRDFFHALVDETHNFSGQVLLVHGDSHYFRIDKAMVEILNDSDEPSTPNFTRVEVFGSADNSWIEMTVDPKSENVFSFAPVVLTPNCFVHPDACSYP